MRPPIRLALSSGIRLSVSITGRGPTIVFHQGFSLTQRIWSAIVEDLSIDHQCITFDPRGHGQSDIPAGGYSVKQLAADLTELVDVLESTDVTLVGHSLGGAVSMVSVVNDTAKKRFSKLVLLGPAVPSFVRRAGLPFGVEPAEFAALRHSIEQDFAAHAQRTADMFFHRTERAFAQELFAETLAMPTPVASTLFCALGDINLTERLSDVAIPVLALWGKHDKLSDPRWTTWIRDQNLPLWTVDTLPHSGHAPMTDEPQVLAARIRDFIR